MTKNPKILLVDDEGHVRSALRRILRPEGYEILEAQDAEQALAVLAGENIQLIISDMRMPGMDGAELLKIVSETYENVRRIVLTGYASVERAVAAINEGGVNRYLTKPWENEELKRVVRNELSAAQENITREVKVDSLKHNVRELRKKNDVSAGLLTTTTDLLKTLPYEPLVRSYVTLAESQMPSKVTLINEVERRADAIAESLGMDEGFRQTLSWAVRLHRFGELALPFDLVQKCFMDMRQQEWDEYQQYASISASFVESRDVGLKSIIAMHRHPYTDTKQERTKLMSDPDYLASNILLVATEYVELKHWKDIDKDHEKKIERYFKSSGNRRYPNELVDAVLAVEI